MMPSSYIDPGPFLGIAPRPTPELRNRLFGRVDRNTPPPLRTIALLAHEHGPQIVYRQVHPLAFSPIVNLFAAWLHAGLAPYVLTVDRVYEHRFSPDGRPLTHAHGNAFDVNSQWNPLNAPRPPEGATGHIPDRMLDIARRMGFWVGTDWRNPAHKHFEVTDLGSHKI